MQKVINYYLNNNGKEAKGKGLPQLSYKNKVYTWDQINGKATVNLKKYYIVILIIVRPKKRK